MERTLENIFKYENNCIKLIDRMQRKIFGNCQKIADTIDEGNVKEFRRGNG
jgi:hypothetical protein